jgi:hypothetical protein
MEPTSRNLLVQTVRRPKLEFMRMKNENAVLAASPNIQWYAVADQVFILELIFPHVNEIMLFDSIKATRMEVEHHGSP